MKSQSLAISREGPGLLHILTVGQGLRLASSVRTCPERAFSHHSEHDVTAVGTPNRITGTSAERQAGHDVPLQIIDPNVPFRCQSQPATVRRQMRVPVAAGL